MRTHPTAIYRTAAHSATIRGTMAWLLALLLMPFAATAAEAVSTKASGSERTTRTYDTSRLSAKEQTAPDGKTYTRIAWEGLQTVGEAGAPELPVDRFRFVVPTYSNNLRVRVEEVETASSVKPPACIYPAQEDVHCDGETKTGFRSPDANAYGQDLGIKAEVEDEFFMDGCVHMVTVSVTPLAYNPTAGTITAAKRLNVTLEYDECDARDMAVKPLIPPHRTSFIDFSRFVENPERISSANYMRAPAKAASTASRYYIVTCRKLHDAFKPLAAWKRAKGYNAIIKDVEDIYTEYPIGSTEELKDSAACVRQYLKDEFQSHGAFFCLLGGDFKTPVPIRRARSASTLSNYPVSPFDYRFEPTDNYFADLVNDYSLSRPSSQKEYSYYYGDYSFSPSIYVGRLNAHTPEQVGNYLYKLFLYEMNPGYGDNAYLDRVLFLEHKDLIARKSVDDILTELNFLPDIKRIKDPNPKSDSLSNLPGTSGAIMVKEMAESGLSSWQGHGTPIGIRFVEGKYLRRYITSLDSIRKAIHDGYQIEETGNGLENMTNFTKPGIVYSISCDNMPYGPLVESDGHIYYEQYDLGEGYTTMGKYGGVAFLGNTRKGWLKFSPYLEMDFYKAIKKDLHLGIAENSSKVLYNPRDDMSSRHNLIGDPEL